MGECLVDNRAGILSDEKSVLDVFHERIERAMRNGEAISFHIAVGFFFFEGFQRLYPLLKQLDSKGLLKSFRLVMGPETKRTTKEVLEALTKDATLLRDDASEFMKELYDRKKFEFRIFLQRGFHVKLYLFDFERSGLDIARACGFKLHVGIFKIAYLVAKLRQFAVQSLERVNILPEFFCF